MAGYNRIFNFNNVPSISFSLFRNWIVNTYSTSLRKHIDPDDLSKPKKPLPPFLRYCKIVRPKILEENPDLKVTKVIQEAAKRWNFLDSTAKNEYSIDYRKDLECYAMKLRDYQNSLSPEHIELLNKTKKKSRILRMKDINKQKLVNLGKPKAPLAPFLQFITDKRGTEPICEPYRDWLKKRTAEWKCSPQEVKDNYSQAWRAKVVDHKETLRIWQEKMIAEGHLDTILNCNVKKVPKK